MQYQGIIFDFNGVLFWDSHLQEKAWKEFSAQLRGTPFSAEELFENVHGKTNKSTLEYILQRRVTQQELESLAHEKESLYQSLCLQNPAEFQLSPGALDLLNYLTSNNIPRTIATASNGNNLQFFIDHLQLDRWFECTKIVYDDGSYPGKLEMYLKAAQNLNLLPKECIVIEDSKTGIIAAHKAKIGKIIGLGPKEKHNLLLNIEAVSLAISSLNQFPKNLVNIPLA
jgi:HAD superfamily hydrolase (TIGR01509 family)